MRSILTVLTPPTETDLTTLARLKQELGITDSAQDDELDALIAAASRAAQSWLGRQLGRATLSEAFRIDAYEAVENLILRCYPVASVTKVVVDETTLTPCAYDSDGVMTTFGDYEVDKDTAQIYRLCNGYRANWWACRQTVVVSVAGYLLPGQSGRNLPEDIEQGVVAWSRGLWMARRRDALLKREVIPQVYEAEYWIGAQGQIGDPPPDVMSLLSPYRSLR